MRDQLDRIFNLGPSIKIAKELSFFYKKRAFKSIEHIADKLCKVTKQDQCVVLNLLYKLRKFQVSTLFYVFNADLVDALLHQKKIESVKGVLDRFSSTPINKFISGKLKVFNLDKYSWSLKFAAETVKEADEVNGTGYAYMAPVVYEQLLDNKKIITQALCLIKKSFGNTFYSEISHFVSDIILFDGKGITGGSSSRVMGAIFIRIPSCIQNGPIEKHVTLLHLTPLVYYLEQITHEVAHLYLDQLMAFDPIVLNNQEEKYASPIRRDKRPMRGVFHATFVLARLVIFFTELNKLQEEDEISRTNRLNSLRELLKTGVETIRKHGFLTPLGKQIFSQIINVSETHYA